MSFIVHKSLNLNGTVEIGGSKNASLPILAAAILPNSPCTLTGVPRLADTDNMITLLKSLKISVENKNKNSIVIDGLKLDSKTVDYDVMSLLRASFLVLGPLVAKTGFAKIALPGGCAIGSRPIDLHLKGLSLMGAKISRAHGFVVVKAKKLLGAEIYLDFPSVGATENIMMAATLADGITTIENAATEPEIADLAVFLNSAGAKIKGAGTDRITITGVKSLNGTKHKIIPDRIEAGTFMTAAAITKGNLTLTNVCPKHLTPVSSKLIEMGAKIIENTNSINISCEGKIKPSNIKTMPYPGFPTDMQAQFASVLSVTEGSSLIVETIFENRFMHLQELTRMGANVNIEGQTAVINGTKKLTGTKVSASDLRAGAALVLAGLVADDETVIDNAYHIDRGYENFDLKLKGIGADITRVQ